MELEIDHLHAFAAWLAHGPGTVRQVAVRADVALIMLHPRTQELHAVGGLHVMGQSEKEGPIYSAVTSAVHMPSTADVVERGINTLPVLDQVSIAAGIMARHGRRGQRVAGAREQPEIPLAGDAADVVEQPAAPRVFALE